MVQIEDEQYNDPVIIVCAGPPLCGLSDDAAVEAQLAECEFCTRYIIHADGTETVIKRTVQ